MGRRYSFGIFNNSVISKLSGNTFAHFHKVAYTGTVAFDLSSMSPYIINSNALWEIQLDGIDEATLNIIASDIIRTSHAQKHFVRATLPVRNDMYQMQKSF